MAVESPERRNIVSKEPDEAAVREQLGRMLVNPHFCHSRRFPSFLRYVVEQTLTGQTGPLKERTIGSEVFGKDPDYDTASDPIVRVTAVEIRKRIAQYYQEPGHRDELQISLPPGSYVPQFQWPRSDSELFQFAQPERPVLPVLEQAAGEANEVVVAPAKAAKKWQIIAAGFAVLAILATGGWFALRPQPSRLDRFWAPIFKPDEPVAICYPLNHFDEMVLRDAANPIQFKLLKEDTAALVVDDLQPVVSIGGLLELHRQPYLLVGADRATLTDLRRGPTVFVGAFDNEWTLRMTRGLRFRFANDADMTHFWIEDTLSPAHTRWEVDRGQQQAINNYRDYAIVARFQDSTTGKIAVILAGIARGGTVAAGEFLTIPNNIEAIKSRAPKNWDGQNMEFVLSTEIIDGRSSPPKVEAAYFW